jgi:hypothetical protein
MNPMSVPAGRAGRFALFSSTALWMDSFIALQRRRVRQLSILS